MDDRSDTPAGFNVIFPGMVAHAMAMGLVIPLAPADVDAILRLHDTELKRFVFLPHHPPFILNSHLPISYRSLPLMDGIMESLTLSTVFSN
jgi:hypothetical protein